MDALILRNNSFEPLQEDELFKVDGGMAPAWLYAAAFVAGVSPLALCVGTGLVVAGVIVYAVASSSH